MGYHIAVKDFLSGTAALLFLLNLWHTAMTGNVNHGGDMESEKRRTIREQIIQGLETKPMTARDLSKVLHISEKEVYAHMPHVEKSISQLKKKIKTNPCCCLKCGFEFKNRKNFKKPVRGHPISGKWE
jgi:predicted Zn-ribbon and HTH transcriptional regulator